MSISIKNKKNELIQWLSTLEDVSIIDSILNLRKDVETDWWDALSKEEQQDIEQSMLQAKEGQIVDNEEVMKIFNKWH